MSGERHAKGRHLRELHSEVDNVGVQDFVLLEDFKSEDAFIDNLKKRFQKDLIYTYISNVVISVNPYHQLSIYSPDHIHIYQNVNLYELPPHVFALADQAYRCMRDELLDQCILISGESGAGKTEASKKILQFLAQTSTNTGKAGNIRDRLLQSNPILEAFGNAKTIRNDNSSRFGKYMEIQFDFKGEPLGGKILNYLLEKCRVVYQTPGERNFHIFYMLVNCGDASLLKHLDLAGATSDDFYYTQQGRSCNVNGVNDTDAFREMRDAFKRLGFEDAEIKDLFGVVAGVLHIGQLQFDAINNDECVMATPQILPRISKLLGVSQQLLNECFTHKSVLARNQEIQGNLSKEQAYYGRDALAKAVYDRLFGWLVRRINKSLQTQHGGRQTVMGLLDIYGFEIMTVNSFEQFCINYCNEKLQQLFIELTLKSEQEEYRSEGISWQTIDYFNNKIICDMVEQKHKGIIAILNEECIRPGKVSDHTFLERLNQELGRHPHYRSHATVSHKQRKSLSIGRDDFQIKHYAGDVNYTADGFIDKNNDQLFRDLKDAMSKSTSPILQDCFPRTELESRRRPPTAGTQFKTSLNALIDILMAKTPSYVRCIKPNHDKRAGVFDVDVVRHQVKYLGLMENLRVRRAGFAYRRRFEVFLDRYKPLCPDTWPHWDGAPSAGVQRIMDHLGYSEEDYQMGKTKIFIRFPKTLFTIERLFEERRHWIATRIQTRFRGYAKRKHFLALKAAAVVMAKNWRRKAAQKRLGQLKLAYTTLRLAMIRWIRRRHHAKEIIEKFIRGFNNRHKPRCAENAQFLDFVRHRWLLELRDSLPQSVLDKTWIKRTPPYLQETSKLLRTMHHRQMCKQYRDAITRTPARQRALVLKLLASETFHNKKLLYPNSIAELFQEDRCEPVPLSQHPNRNTVFKTMDKFGRDTQVRYSATVTKFDRKTFKSRVYVLVVTNAGILILYKDSLKLNFRLDFSHLLGISVSRKFDGIFVLHASPETPHNKGDWVLHTPHVIEAVTQIAYVANKAKDVKVQESITFERKNHTQAQIVFAVDATPGFRRNKQRQLEVVAPALHVPDHYRRYRAFLSEQASGNTAVVPPSVEDAKKRERNQSHQQHGGQRVLSPHQQWLERQRALSRTRLQNPPPPRQQQQQRSQRPMLQLNVSDHLYGEVDDSSPSVQEPQHVYGEVQDPMTKPNTSAAPAASSSNPFGQPLPQFTAQQQQQQQRGPTLKLGDHMYGEVMDPVADSIYGDPEAGLQQNPPQSIYGEVDAPGEEMYDTVQAVAPVTKNGVHHMQKAQPSWPLPAAAGKPPTTHSLAGHQGRGQPRRINPRQSTRGDGQGDNALHENSMA